MANKRERKVELSNTRDEDVAQHQFPSLEGEEGVEVAKRGADNHETDTLIHRKVFTVPKDQYNEDTADDEDGLHARNIRAVRTEMMNNGLRPDSDVTFEGSHPDENDPNRSVHLVYTVGAQAAVLADEFTVEHAMVREDEQHLLEEGVPSPRDHTTGRQTAQQQKDALETE